MKNSKATVALALAAALAFAGNVAAREAGQSGMREGSSATGTTSAATQGQAGQQIRPVGDLEKFTVQSTQGQKVGKVNKAVVDIEQGRIAYVLVQPEQGEGNYIIPWKALQSNPQQQTLTLNKSPEQLRQAPKGDIKAIDRQMGRQIHQFYGVSPYWEESGQQGRGMMMDHGGMMERQQQQQQQRTPGTGM